MVRFHANSAYYFPGKQPLTGKQKSGIGHVNDTADYNACDKRQYVSNDRVHKGRDLVWMVGFDE